MLGQDKNPQKGDRSCAAMVYRTSVSHFKVINTPLKDTDGKGKFKRMLSFFYVGQREAFFFYKIVLRGIRISVDFRHRSAWPVLKRNQAAKFLKNFQVHFVLFSQENNVLKRELCISKH